MDLKKYIRSIPDYPKKGILFRDITTLIKNPEAFRFTNDKIIEIAKIISKIVNCDIEFLDKSKLDQNELFNDRKILKCATFTLAC